MPKDKNTGPPMPDHLGPAGRAEWEAAVALAEAKGPGSFPWSAYAGHVLAAAEQADLVAFTTAEWEAAGRPLVTTYNNGSEGSSVLWRAVMEARKAYGTAHGSWAGRAERQPTTNAPGRPVGSNRAADRMGNGEPPLSSGAEQREATAREALRLVREATA